MEEGWFHTPLPNQTIGLQKSLSPVFSYPEAVENDHIPGDTQIQKLGENRKLASELILFKYCEGKAFVQTSNRGKEELAGISKKF